MRLLSLQPPDLSDEQLELLINAFFLSNEAFARLLHLLRETRSLRRSEASLLRFVPGCLDRVLQQVSILDAEMCRAVYVYLVEEGLLIDNILNLNALQQILLLEFGLIGAR